MSINWSILAPADEPLQIPTYGNYGGPDYAGGRLLEPGEKPTFTVAPTDQLDALFRKHDMAVINAQTSLEQAKADLRLIKGIMKLSPDAVSGEGDLYAGAAILGAIGRIVVSDRHPELLAKIDLQKTVDKAISLIKSGSIRPDAEERASLASWLQHIGDALSSGSETTLTLAADKLVHLADSMHGKNARDLHLTLGDNALHFTVGEAKSLLVQAAEAIAETGHADHSGGLAAVYDNAVHALSTHQLETLVDKLGSHFELGDFHF